MSGPVEIQRKVRQLDNDVQAIYEMLSSIAATQLRQGNRLAEIADVQTEHGNGLTEIANVQVGQGAKLEAILELLRRSQ